MSRTILEIESLYKTYGEKENAAEALRGISFQYIRENSSELWEAAVREKRRC